MKAISLSLFVFLLFPWTCITKTLKEDIECVKALFLSTNGENWLEGFEWTKGFELNLDPCDDIEFFKGIECTGNSWDSNRRIKSLWLSHLNLNGTLPDELGGLGYLNYIYLADNAIQGSIPHSICNLTNLTDLNVAMNNLSGSIPDCIGDMRNLVILDLRSNALSGGLPASIARLSNLQQLLLADNRLAGPIPPELFQARRLEHLWLSRNSLTGPLPATFSRFKVKEGPSSSGLLSLDLRGNRLEGPVPEVAAVLAAV